MKKIIKGKSIFEMAKAISDKERVRLTIDQWNQFKMERGEEVIIPQVTNVNNMRQIIESLYLLVEFQYGLHKYKDVNEAIWWTLYKEKPLSKYIKDRE